MVEEPRGGHYSSGISAPEAENTLKLWHICHACRKDTVPLSLVEHAFWALVLQALVGVLTRNWWAGAALACGYFIGREVAQAEYRWIEEFGQGLRAHMPWWGAFDPRVWPKADQLADWIGPLVVTPLAAILAGRRARRRPHAKSLRC